MVLTRPILKWAVRHFRTSMWGCDPGGSVEFRRDAGGCRHGGPSYTNAVSKSATEQVHGSIVFFPGFLSQPF
jgi:hypothetical protein